MCGTGRPVLGRDATSRFPKRLEQGRMAELPTTVIVIDDDAAIRESVDSLLRSVGLQVKLLDSVDEFVKTGRPPGPSCLVLDVRLPGRSGLDFQSDLAAANIHL